MTKHSHKMQVNIYIGLGIVLFGLTVSCISNPESGLSGLELKSPQSADPFEVVNCLLPGQIRQLGTRVTYLTERRPIRTTAEDCAIRGGEYVAMDRADYGTALKVWMSAAQGGDPDAQYYVGVLYEKGAEGQPNFAQAATWYRKAAERGVSRAAMNLGRLYEQGLGVAKNIGEAYTWYAKASGVKDANLGERSEGQRAETGAKGTVDQVKQAEPVQERVEALQRELAEVRTRLTERTSLLDEERRKLEQLKQEYERAGAQHASQPRPPAQETLVKQERVVKEREGEVAKLQANVTSLKQEARQQVAQLHASPGQDLGLRGPTIQIIDPPVVITRGIRVEQGRIPVMIAAGRPARITGRAIAAAGLRSLTVNEQQTVVDEQGTFSVDVPTAEPNQRGIPVDILAVDMQNKQGTMRLLLNSPSAIARAGEDEVISSPGFGQYYALVIGIDHYRQWTPLNTAIADAVAVAKLLKERYGFQVTLLKDTTRRDILKALNEFRKRLTERDNLLIYYAGHGFLEPEIDRGYWIPIEGDLQDNSEWIEFPAVTDLLQLIPAKQVLVVADSCFAGKLSRSALARLGPDLQDQTRQTMLRTLADQKIRTTLTSGGAKPVLDDGGTGHSVFAIAFLSVLSENTTMLETERLFWAVRSRVVEAAERLKFEQVPTYAPIHMAGHEGLGDFVFVPMGDHAPLH